MIKRIFILFAIVFFIAGFYLPPLSSIADDVQKTVTWRVPENVTLIRIQSWDAEGQLKIDRSINVEPGQKFQVDAIE